VLRTTDQVAVTMIRALRIHVLAITTVLAIAAPAHGANGSGGLQAADDAPAPVSQAATGGQAVAPPAPAGSGGATFAEAASTAPAPAPSPVPITAPAGGPVIAADVPFGPLIATTARRYNLSVALFTALVWQESGFRARARSKAGARGLTQLMPATARELGVRKIYDPAQNLDGGARYLVAQLNRFGSAQLALAAYNAGPNAVAKHRGIPPYRETRRYVANILAIEQHLRAAGVR
jgi:soluble lytic murein transglycosylase-like protein